MAMGRFMVPALPFIAVLLATLLNRFGRDSERRRFLAVGSVAVCTLVTVAPAFNLHLVPRSTLERFDFRQKATGFRTEYEVWRVMKENAERWSQLGRALALVAKPGESLITGVIGAIGYYSNLFIYDRYGLVTREVALLPPRDEVHKQVILVSIGVLQLVETRIIKPRESWVDDPDMRETIAREGNGAIIGVGL